jgi:adenylate cyclase
MLTLPRFFALSIGALAALAALVLVLSVRTASEAVVRTGEASRELVASRVASSIEAELGAAERAVGDFEKALALGAVDDRDPASLGNWLLAEAIALPNLTDLTLTAGEFARYEDDGSMTLERAGRRQMAAFRDAENVLRVRTAPPFEPDSPADPTRHDTFRMSARRDLKGRAIWSDLAYSELDAEGAGSWRRKTLSVQKAVFGKGDRFVGVLRAGIVSDTIDHLGDNTASADHDVFICDASGRLVTRLDGRDPYELVDEAGKPDPENGDLRVVPAALSARVAAALAFAKGGGRGATRVVAGGEPTLVTLRPVAEGRAQEWLVGIAVPERVYVGPLLAARDRLLLLLGLVVAAIAVVAYLGARTVSRGVGSLVASTEAMRRFSFTAAPPGRPSPFAEIRAAQESVERAKTALRAMVKYVPVGLVRRLYESGHDPVLGADLMDLALMFTDIEGFTSLAEALPPARLAEALGRYLEAATVAVEGTGGIVDKYIGDALMVMWNAPAPVAEPARAACDAALACARATAACATSDWWREQGLPPWRTRFGLHAARVLVGHFGAPDRLSYTAMGDGVNLASRLEGLNKVYGTTILASEDLRAQAGDRFAFRLVDRVAVKGRTRGVAVYELLGLADDAEVAARAARLQPYEAALRAAWERQFARALELLGPLCEDPDDPPSVVLAARCRAWLAAPPPAEWDGTFVATSK